MKLVTPRQMNAIDTCTINDCGIPGILLMENAAAAVASEAVSMAENGKSRPIVILAGRGNNGGDAFAVARLLHSRGYDVKVYLTGAKKGISGDALINLSILERLGIGVEELVKEELIDEKLIDEKHTNKRRAGEKLVDEKPIDEKKLDSLRNEMHQSCLIIDGIFGTGLSREVDGLAKLVIDAANNSGKPILAIDIPSGVDGTNGSVQGSCIKADATVTFCLPKTGLVQNPGCEYTGRLITANIGIPRCVIEKQEILTELMDAERVRMLIPTRRPNSNKSDYGRVMLVTGSTGMTGSGCLASMAALRSGAGLVYAGVPRSLMHVYGAAITEPIILPLEDGGSGCLTVECAEHILEHMKRMDAAAIGPGLTASADITRIMEKIISESTIPLVLDADALNAISGNTSILKKLSVDAVVTPHPGEMSRLTGLHINEIQSDRIGTAKNFAEEFGVTVVLKGSRTVIALPDGRVFINPTGNAGMASAGTGDVLTGIIAGLLAQGAGTEDAAAAGVFLHGLAGDAAAAEMGMHGMVAGDVIKYLPQTIKMSSIEQALYFKIPN